MSREIFTGFLSLMQFFFFLECSHMVIINGKTPEVIVIEIFIVSAKTKQNKKKRAHTLNNWDKTSRNMYRFRRRATKKKNVIDQK